jgi:dephospho-CoA kinase
MTTLHLLCGKIASGKSTLAPNIARDNNAVLISEDYLLSCLYVGEIRIVDVLIFFNKKVCRDQRCCQQRNCGSN